MAAVALPNIRFQIARPQFVDGVSISRTGTRAISAFEYADSFLQVQMRTVALSASEIVLVRSWATDAVRKGIQSVIYTPNDYCLPRAYWGNPTAPALSNLGNLVSVTNGYNVVIDSVTNGLTYQPGDRLSLQDGDYRSLHEVAVGAVAAGNSMSLTLVNPVPAFITAGAVARFYKPEMNARVLPNTFVVPDEFNPVASFTLVEVPR